MQEIDIQDLVADGYREDHEARERFEKPYAMRFLACLVAAMVPIPFLSAGWLSPWVAMPTIVLLWCVIALLLAKFHRANPLSQHSQKPYLKYRNRSPEPPVITETVYVCPASKTYFREVISVNPE